MKVDDMNIFNNKFGIRLEQLLAFNNKSKKDLANVIGVSPQAVSSYCKGNIMPSVEKICQIADYFKVSVDYLLGKVNLYKIDNVPESVCGLVNKLSQCFSKCSISENNPNFIQFNPKPKFKHVHNIFIMRDGSTTERKIVLDMIQNMSAYTHNSNKCFSSSSMDDRSYFRDSINAFLGTDLSEDDFRLMYQLLYKDDAAERFIESGFSKDYLQTKKKLHDAFMNY